jgi:dienelactone hydrolase
MRTPSCGAARFRRQGRTRKLVGSMRLPIALLASAALLAPAGAHAAVTPPPPTGPAPVGLQRLTLTDHHRRERLAPGGGPRLIPLRVWYPAARPGSAPGQVLTPTEQSTYESIFELPARALDGIGSTTTAAAPPAAGKRPVVLLSPGWGNTSGLHNAQASDLASHGYVVIGIDHPGDTVAVDAGAGHILKMNPAGEKIQNKSAVQRVADVRYVLHHLGAIHGAGSLDRRRIGAYGHSMGARATATAMYYEPSIRAGVNLDGLADEPVLSHGLDQPYAIGSGVHPPDAGHMLDKIVAQLRRHLRGPHPMRIFGNTEHAGFTDNVWLVPQLDLPTEGQELGSVTPTAAVSGQRSFLRGFFDRYL